MTVEHSPSPYGPRDGGNHGGRHLNEAHWEDEYFYTAAQDFDTGDLLLAMEGLTERQRFVVECRFGLRQGAEGRAMSHREIASLMGLAHPTVVEHEQAALVRLRRSLLATTTPSTS